MRAFILVASTLVGLCPAFAGHYECTPCHPSGDGRHYEFEITYVSDGGATQTFNGATTFSLPYCDLIRAEENRCGRGTEWVNNLDARNLSRLLLQPNVARCLERGGLASSLPENTKVDIKQIKRVDQRRFYDILVEFAENGTTETKIIQLSDKGCEVK